MIETDLVVVGGGVMGLFTAYHASGLGRRVTVLERGRIGDPKTASYGRTRSYRNDYLDALYTRLARESIRLWDEFEAAEGVRALVRCGCLNIASASVTPDLAGSYARMTHDVLEQVGLPSEALGPDAMQARFPDLVADFGQLDPGAGVADLVAVRETLVRALDERGVTVLEDAAPTAIAYDGSSYTVSTAAAQTVVGSTLVVTAGHGTNDVLALLDDTALQVPITKDRPSEARYYSPSEEDRARFTADALPVVAYLDTGIYLHPIVPGVVDAVKVGYYNPPDVPRDTTSIDSIDAFAEQCLPALVGMAWTPVEDVDGCDYDLVADDHFVLGPIPGLAHAFVGVGWRGTGYKFAPWVGRVLSELAVQSGTVYDISSFDPSRFTTENHEPVTEDPAAATR